MPGITARQNGKLGGRPKGRKNDKTLEREASRKAYEQLALRNLEPIFQKQLLSALGQVFVYKRVVHGKGSAARIEHELLDNPHEIADALDKLGNHDPQNIEDGEFLYISTKAPSERAADSILDRSIGKPAQPISGDKDNPLELVTVVKYAKGDKPSA